MCSTLIQRNLTKKLFLLAIILTLSNCFNLNSISTLTQDNLFSDPFVQISVSAVIDPLDFDNSVQDFDQFVLRTTQKHKRKAYLKLVKNYDKLVSLLKKQIIIGDQSLLIKSKIKEKYLRKKRLWEFSILFIIKQSSVFVKQYGREINKLGIIKVNSKQKSLIFNSKILAINTFFQAKRRVQFALSKYKKTCIDSVKTIELSGFNLDDTQLINLDLSEEQTTTQSSDNQRNSQQEYNSYFFHENSQAPKKNKPKLTAIFKIKRNCEKFYDQNSNYVEKSSSDSQFVEQSSTKSVLSDSQL